MEPLVLHATVDAPVSEVWRAWTTTEGIVRFFPEQAWVDLRIGGPFEMYFLLDEPPGGRGSETCRILAYVPERMLAFSWNNPPHLASIRFAHTWVVLFFEADGAGTRLELVHQGWGEGPVWEEAHAYFAAAWRRVLDRLVDLYAEAAG